MKILIIHNYYQQAGGERIAVEAQIALLRERGHTVQLYTRDNVELNNYKLWQKVSFFLNAIFSPGTYREIQRLIATEQPEVAHIHNIFPLISPTVYRGLKKMGVPIVQTVHNFRFLCPNGLFYTHQQICERCKYGNTLHAVRWKCYRQSFILSALYALIIGIHRRWRTFETIDRFIALTEFTSQKLVESGLTTGDKISILGNFLNEPLPMQGSSNKRKSYLIYLGRLSPEKGVNVLLKAMIGLPTDIGLKIAGDGPEADVLRANAKQQGLTQVEFVGHIRGEAKWELLRQAIATIVPSIWYETFGITALESLAVGTPVVASRIGSLPYIVNNGQTGLLFRPGDAEDLREKLLYLIAHPQQALAMGQYGRDTVDLKWVGDRHYEELMKIYAEVTHPNGNI